MPGSDTTPNHARWMGTLIVNLQSLEFALRGFLYNCETGWTSQRGSRFFENITEGQQLEVNAFTNYDTLAKLIEKYNSRVRSRDSDLQVDGAVARVRDALAHGRIAGLSPSLDEPLRLVKYNKPANGLVRVTDYCILTEEWFDEKGELVAQSIAEVMRAMELFGRM
jgi:hypothetical protein